MRRLFITSLLLLLSAASAAHADTVVCSQVARYTPEPLPRAPVRLKQPDPVKSPDPNPGVTTRERSGTRQGEAQLPLPPPKPRLRSSVLPLGTWEGEVQLARSRLCIGFVIEAIQDKDELDVTYAYNSETFAPVEIAGISKYGVMTSQIGRYHNGVLTLNGSELISFEFARTNDDTLKGYLVQGTAKYDARVKRQRIFNLIAN